MIPSKRTEQASAAVVRPSEKELWKKLTEAKELIKRAKWLPAAPPKLRADFEELETLFDIETALPEDQSAILLTALEEIAAADYVGSRPPMRSYERATHNQEMFAFHWKSAHFKCEMYFKFCFSGADKGRRAWVFSIHPHREDQDAD